MSGIQISVEVRYIEKESDPALPRYLFAYTIAIANHGETAGQLLNRHWIITDAQGDVQEVSGPGVVGAVALDQGGDPIAAAPVEFAAPDLDHVQQVGDLDESERSGGHGSQFS